MRASTLKRGFGYAGLSLALVMAAGLVARADGGLITFNEKDLLSASAMNANFTDLDTRLKALSARIDTLEASKATLEQANTDLLGRVGKLEAQVLTLEAAQGEPTCPPGYTHDETEKTFVLCTRGSPAYDEVVKVGTGASAFWIDRYEDSLWSNPDGTGTTYGNNTADLPIEINGQKKEDGQGDGALYALSRANTAPSTHMTWYQANVACARTGKQLPSVSEWLLAAQDTPDPGQTPGTNGECATDLGGVRNAGKGTLCRSRWGAEDMIGNLWEITREWALSPGLYEPKTQGGVPIPDLDISAQGTKALPSPIFRSDATWGIMSAGESKFIYGATLSHVPNRVLLGGSRLNGVHAGIFAIAVNESLMERTLIAGVRCMIARAR